MRTNRTSVFNIINDSSTGNYLVINVRSITTRVTDGARILAPTYTKAARFHLDGETGANIFYQELKKSCSLRF